MSNSLISLIACSILLFGCRPIPSKTDEADLTNMFAIDEAALLKPKPKNIILMIGDGMGLTQTTAGLYSNDNKLELERATNVGLHKSYSSRDLITDSAAGATAFACGKKTYNGAIGVDNDTMSIPTILELAEKAGMKTGLIATSTIVHATPASFIAHVDSRKKYEDIAKWFVKNEVDIFIGGGKKYFDRRDTDSLNLIEILRGKNYVVEDYFNNNLTEAKPDLNKKFAFFTADDNPLTVEQGRDYLALAAKMAVEYLSATSGDNGFFLMIEGSQIDWGGHANNSNYIITEMLDFDQTIGTVFDFAEKDKKTLVVITADHETGGYSIILGSKLDSLVTAFTTSYHTATLIPVYSFGPGAGIFSGIYENTDIHRKMCKALSL